jgi:membrane fusion protein, multidrug efflux system
MNKRSLITGLIILLAGIFIIVIITRLLKPTTNQENEEVAPEMAVHTAAITRATLHRYITAYGSVQPEPASENRLPASAQVASPVAGIIASINAVEGQHVSKNAIIIQLDSRIADVEVQKAQQALEFAEKNFDRQKMLIPAEGTSKKAYQEAEQALATARDELKSAEIQRGLLDIKAPLSGTLTEVNVRPGEAIDANTVLAEIIDLDRLVAVANIPSQEAPLLKLGQRMIFSSKKESAPAESVSRTSNTGIITFIDEQIDPKTDTLEVRASIPAKSGYRPGQYLNFHIICEEHRNVLAAPEVSVIKEVNGNTTLWIVEGDKVVSKIVKTGLRESGMVEIEGAGIKEGMVIVTDEAYSIPNETKIHIITK